MKVSREIKKEEAIKRMRAFILVFTFIIVFTLYPLLMLLTFADGREEGTDYYLFKNEFIERYGTPKRFFVTVWNISEQIIIDNWR